MSDVTFQSGSRRSGTIAGERDRPVRYDFITPIGLRRLAETYAEGAAKYGDDNWKLGQPNAVILNHVLGHLAEHMRGDRSEDHLAHAAWGLFALMHFEECEPIKPEANDSGGVARLETATSVPTFVTGSS